MPWKVAAQVKADYAITVTDAQLLTARGECLRVKGLALDTEEPPHPSWDEGVAMQALANRQATQADPADEFGAQAGGVQLRPFGAAVMSKLIIPKPDPDDPTRDTGRTGSLVG